VRKLYLFTVLSLLASCATSGSAGSDTDKAQKDKPLDLPPIFGEQNPREVESPILPPAESTEAMTAIVGATLLLGNGARVDDGSIVMKGRTIMEVGPASKVQVPKDAQVIDAKGRFVTPGLIDTHSHLGVYATPHVKATADGNEMTDPTTPYVFSEHAFWPQDPGLRRAVMGGVTTIQVLPGSGNVIGGRAVVLQMDPRRETRAMRLMQAPNGLKMACGENPKRVYGDKGRQPMSRMGSISILRRAFIKAQAYRHAHKIHLHERTKWMKKYEAAKQGKAKAEKPGKEPYGPARDIGMETLADVLDGKIKVHIHCYRADEMLQMIALSKELGFKISSFHHATSAYKIADVLALEKIGASMWSDWWGFKLEAWDAVEENVAMVAAAGARAIVHSDSGIGIQHLNQEASKAYNSGRRAGLKVTEDMAIQWITLNPAWALGIDHLTGSLEKGKFADLVLWDKHPLSIYARTDAVYVGGREVFSRTAPPRAWSDFEVGTDVEEVNP
jgi:imidazolonepropionase-like amidohydrolase